MEKDVSLETPVHSPVNSFQEVKSPVEVLHTPESWTGFFDNTSYLAHYQNILLGVPPSPGSRRFRGLMTSGDRVGDLELAHEEHRKKFTPLFPENLEDASWKNLTKSPIEIPAAISLLYPWMGNYEHYFLEVYPRLELFLKILEISSALPVLLPANSPSFIQESLSYLGVTNIYQLNPEKSYLVQSLFTASATGIDFHSVSECAYTFYERLRTIESASASSPERIYISRRFLEKGDGAARRLTNEEEVFSLFARYGFVEIPLEQKTFSEKLTLFRSAQYIAGPFGAGMFTGVVSSRESTIMLLDPPLRDSSWFKIPFKHAARNLYHLKHGQSEAGTSQIHYNASWLIDINSLENALQQIFGNK